MNDIISDIKQELRANMNGVASSYMRQTDDYRVNWGIELPRIHDIAREFEPSHELAQALWKENVRECKILATILMPAEGFDEELCDIWAESIRTEEIAQIFCLNMMTRLSYASVKAFEWIAKGEDVDERGRGEVRRSYPGCQLENCGYLTLCHLMRKGELQERAANEFIDQAAASLDNKYAIKALQIYGAQSDDNARRVKKIGDYLI